MQNSHFNYEGRVYLSNNADQRQIELQRFASELHSTRKDSLVAIALHAIKSIKKRKIAEETYAMSSAHQEECREESDLSSKYHFPLHFQEQLIIHVQNEEALWNFRSNPALRRKGKKEAAWARISEAMGHDVTVLKSNWKKIIDNHRRVYKSVQKRKKSGTEARNVRVWPLYESLGFLRDIYKLTNRSPSSTTARFATPLSSSSQNIDAADTDGRIFSTNGRVNRQKKTSNAGTAISAEEVRAIVDAIVHAQVPEPVIVHPASIPPQTAYAAYLDRSIQELPHHEQLNVQKEFNRILCRAQRRVARDDIGYRLT